MRGSMDVSHSQRSPDGCWPLQRLHGHQPRGYIVPDILTLSKTLGKPASGCCRCERRSSQRSRKKGFFFYTTHVNDPLPAAVGDKVLGIVFSDNLVEHSRQCGKILHDGLNKLCSRYGCIGQVRGRRLMAGVEIVTDCETKTPSLKLAKRVGKVRISAWASGEFEHSSKLWRHVSHCAPDYNL